jgi:hypothetical protein
MAAVAGHVQVFGDVAQFGQVFVFERQQIEVVTATHNIAFEYSLASVAIPAIAVVTIAVVSVTVTPITIAAIAVVVVAIVVIAIVVIASALLIRAAIGRESVAGAIAVTVIARVARSRDVLPAILTALRATLLATPTSEYSSTHFGSAIAATKAQATTFHRARIAIFAHLGQTHRTGSSVIRLVHVCCWLIIHGIPGWISVALCGVGSAVLSGRAVVAIVLRCLRSL